MAALRVFSFAAAEAHPSEALMSKARDLTRELELLGGDRADLERLKSVVEKRLESLEALKKAAKKQAEDEVKAYTSEQWERSWFTRDEEAAAVKARQREIFDRPQRRAIEAAKAHLAIVHAVLEAGSAPPNLADAYREIGVALAMNDDLGVMPQVGARVFNIVEKLLPFLRERPGGEATNLVEGTEEAWRRDPVRGSTWRERKPSAVTPERLLAGPWYDADELPRLPAPGETWDMIELRSPKADGGHASIEIALGDDAVKLKFHTEAASGLWVEPTYARLLWAMGWETDPMYAVRDVRMTPRSFAAAFATIATIGLHVGPSADAVVAGRPARGLSFAFNGIEKAPGPGWVVVTYRDGREETGDDAIASLERAIDDRGLLDSMAHVVVKRTYVELPRPGKWEAIGPWSYDTSDHIDDREVRALGIVAVTWLSFDDTKFNNLRLDVSEKKPGEHVLVVADVGITQTTHDLATTTGVRLDGRWLHNDVNAYTIDAFDRMTLADAKWGVVRIGKLTLDQIRACCEAGSFDDAATKLFVDKLVARRNELVSTFGLADELGILDSTR